MENNIYKITYALALLFFTKCKKVNTTNIQTNIDKIASVGNAAAEW
jgi:ribosomal protein L23